MTPAPHPSQFALSRIAIGIYNPPTSESSVAHWRINGYRASILIWTNEEWDRMTDRPGDAQFYPCGVWCALRLE